MASRFISPLVAVLAFVSTAPAHASPFAYVTNDLDSTTSVVDVPTGTVVATIDVGAAGCTRARGIAIAASGLRLYESCLTSNNVAVIDTVTNTVTTTMPLPADPFASADGLALNPVLPRLYAADFVEVAVYDTTTNTFVTTIPITHGGQPEQVEGLAVNPTGTRLYVTQVFSSTVNVIDTATNTEITTIPLAGSRGIVVDPTGAIVYTGGAAGNGTDIHVIDAVTNMIVDTIPLGFGCNAITGIALDPTGAMLYAACVDYVAAVDVVTKTVTPIPVGFIVFGVDVTRDGSQVVAVNEGDDTVSIIDTATLTAGPPITVGDQPFSYPGTFIGPAFTCGNDVREPGEICDGGPCCTPQCTADVGASCSDGDLCTTADTCTASATCAGTAVDCDDGDNCSIDACNPSTGACDHTLTPDALGDDDAGCIPPSKDVAKCEDKVAKTAAKLSLGIAKCHIKAAKAALKSAAFDEEACESAALGKYDDKVASLSACPACLDTAAVRGTVVSQADGATAAAVYCDATSGTLLGDDGGYAPADKATGKCENGASKAIAKLVGALAKCHAKLADAKLASAAFDEEGCETAAVGKFDAARLKLTGCPACLAPVLPGLGAATADERDAENGRIYCAF